MSRGKTVPHPSSFRYHTDHLLSPDFQRCYVLCSSPCFCLPSTIYTKPSILFSLSKPLSSNVCGKRFSGEVSQIVS
ncbi:hypothetical protein L2E82_17146 [Cichorium intybus]|uniref:Uncharacterized protein n=1 Tax=Cichorium intybus TaxID=13427 RepID=A0ACB9F809_CICIN|nr:hypothetical protein L2E82_17146 [Cichorium intybus]